MTDVETPHELVLVNRYDARPDQVWAAWTLPADAVLTRRHDGDAVRRVLPGGRRARAARIHPQRRAVARRRSPYRTHGAAARGGRRHRAGVPPDWRGHR